MTSLGGRLKPTAESKAAAAAGRTATDIDNGFDAAELEAGSPAVLQNSLGCSFGDLRSRESAPREQIILGLARQEIGALNSITNHGKSTLVRNAAISLACGRPFPPLVVKGDARRVVIVEAEDSAIGLRDDLNVMLKNLSAIEGELVENNLWIIADAVIGNADLKLNDPMHLTQVINQANAFKADLIFVDTVSQAFTIRNENDNAEIKECVMKPLKRLAVSADAAVLFIHHIGKAKAEDGLTREGSHKARGASAFGDQSRVIYNLDRDVSNDVTILSCPKIKGLKVADHHLKLDVDSRWFTVEEAAPLRSNYALLIDLFKDDEIELETGQIVQLMAAKKVSRRSVMDNLKDAVGKCTDLEKVRHGVYRKARIIKGLGESAEVQDV